MHTFDRCEEGDRLWSFRTEGLDAEFIPLKYNPTISECKILKLIYIISNN